MSLRKQLLVGASLAATIGAAAMGGAGASAKPAGPSHGQLAHQPAKSSLHGWTKVSSALANPTSEIGLSRFGHELQAVWTGAGSGDAETLNTRNLAVNGHPTSAAIQVAQWATINDFPQVIPFDGGRAIVFAGLRSTDTSDPYTSGTEYFFTSADGRDWSLSDNQMSNGKGAYGSYGSDSIMTGGNAVLVYSNLTSSAVSYHEGYQPLMDTGSPDPTTSSVGGEVHYAGDGADAVSGNVWAVWFTENGSKSTEGVSAQRILPTLGTRVHAPSTTVKSTGAYASISSNQRIDVAARPASKGGGLYSSYAVGYPTAHKIALWRLGASHAHIFKAGPEVYLTDVAPATGGRVWVIWYDRTQHRLHALRTNPSATRLGRACSISEPLKSPSVLHIAGDGSTGPLQLFINAGDNPQGTAIYTRTVKPCLSVHVSPQHVARSGHVTVTVTDAGSPVKGATVSLLGHHAKTNKHGKVTLRVPSSASRGGHHVSVHRDGYQVGGATAHVR